MIEENVSDIIIDEEDWEPVDIRPNLLRSQFMLSIL